MIRKTIAMAARYGSTSLDTALQLPVSTLRWFVEELGEILQEESPEVRRTTD